MQQWRKRLYFVSIAVLIVGLFVAIAIYLRADDSLDFSDAYQVENINGKAHTVAPNDSRVYQRELERMGGKSYLLFDDLNRWIAGLFHGKALAFTVGVSSLVVSLVLFLFARFITWDPGDDSDR